MKKKDFLRKLRHTVILARKEGGVTAGFEAEEEESHLGFRRAVSFSSRC